MFGDNKTDKSQTEQIGNLWKWITNLDTRLKNIEQNQAILVTNNNRFIEKNKAFTEYIGQLQQKDKLHDQKDAEHDQLINSIKSMAKAVEQAEATT